MLETVSGWARRTWWCRCCLVISFQVFWPRDSIISCSSPAVVLEESLDTQTLLLTVHQDDIDTRPLHIHNIFCWLEILNYCSDGGDGDVHCSSSFLKATLLICEAQLSFDAHQKYILCFFSLWWWLREFGLCFLSYLYFCETGSHGWIITYS